MPAAAREPLLSGPGDTSPSPEQQHPDTFWPCVANLSKVIIGAGMMAIPQAYCRIGSFAGTCMLVLVGVMTYTTLVFLLRGSAATGATTYSQLTRQLCGPAVMKVLQLAVLSFCFGFGVVYLVIIRDILLGTPPACNGLLCELFGLPPSSVLADPRLVIVALALLVCSPLLLLRTMDRLAVLNVVGVGAIGMLALTALGLAVKGLSQGTAYPIPLWPQWQLLGHTRAEQLQALMAVVPVMIACYVAHQSLHPLMPLLHPFSDARMRRVIAAALVIAFAVFGSLAVGSSLAFGPTLEVNVLNNFSVSGLQPLTGKPNAQECQAAAAMFCAAAVAGGCMRCCDLAGADASNVCRLPGQWLGAAILAAASQLTAVFCLAGTALSCVLSPGLFLARALSWAIRGGYLLSLLASLLLYMHPLRACLAEMVWPDQLPQGSSPHPGGDWGAAHGVQPSDEASHSLLHPVGGGAAAEDAQYDSSNEVLGGGASRGSSGGGPATQQGSGARAAAGRLLPPTKQRPPMGSAFATPAAQAGVAAAAAAAAPAAGVRDAGKASSGGGSGALGSSDSRQLTTFDSLDNPRTGSWSGVRYLSNLSPRVGEQQAGSRGGHSSGGSGSRSLPTHSIEHGRQHSTQAGPPLPPGQQQGGAAAAAAVVYLRNGIQIHVSDAVGGPAATRQQEQEQQQPWLAAEPGAGCCRWRQLEQQWYYALTYGLLAAMVLVAIAVPNIWTALSAIGDLASTLQAFVVPGFIGLVLTRHSKVTDGSSVHMRLQHAASGGVGCLAVFLGLALFANGIYQRV